MIEPAMFQQASTPAQVLEPVPHVVAWNLTQRCNLRCAHCYLDAGPDVRGDHELSTAECRRIADEVLALNPSPMFILTGGEPLLRADLEAIAGHASSRGATVVVGTNGVFLDKSRIASLKAAGVSGVAISVDSLDQRYHDRFRQGEGALGATLKAIDRCGEAELDFVIQSTLTRGNRQELKSLAAFAAGAGAVSFNVYLVVETGRARRMSALSGSEGEAAIETLAALHDHYLGTMMVRAKCAPQFMRVVHQRNPDSPLMRYASRCPCGVHYCRISPQGELTACPYLPLPAGQLRETGFAEIWHGSEVFAALRSGRLEGRCGRCAYRALCGGCRARAYAHSGDLCAEDPACSYQPDGEEALIEAVPGLKYGQVQAPVLAWSDAACAHMRRVPSFVRGVVMQRVEDYARRHQITEITPELLARMREGMPVDFAVRKPFFLRPKDR